MNPPDSTTTTPFRIALAEDDCFEAVFALHEQLFRWHIGQIWGWHPEWQQTNFRGNWGTCDTHLIESEDGRLIGYRQILQQPDRIFLKNLGLIPDFQGRGIGCRLIRQLQNEAESAGLPIRLSVFVTNPRAQAFYEKLGFIHENRTSEFQHMS
jgi:ribosomal protein S18 acetylase RimI-like enzyme